MGTIAREIPDEFERRLEEQEADLAIFRYTVQTLILRFLSNTDRPVDEFEKIYQLVRHALQEEDSRDASHVAARHKELRMIRADNFFQEIGPGIEETPAQEIGCNG